MKSITQINAPGDGATRTFTGSREYRRDRSGINTDGVQVVWKKRLQDGCVAVTLRQKAGDGFCRIHGIILHRVNWTKHYY